MKPTIYLGPYCLRCHGAEFSSPGVVPLGFGLEWANPAGAKRIPLFRHPPRNASDHLRLESILFPLDRLPFSMKCPQYHLIQGSQSGFAQFESLLVGLYRRFDVRRSICEVLAEIASSIPLPGSVGKPVLANGLLTQEAEARGFRLNMAVRCDDQVLAQIAWKPRDNEYRFHVASFEFGPSNREGKWIKPRVIGVSELLSGELRQFAQGPPCSILSAAGKSLVGTGVLEKAA